MSHRITRQFPQNGFALMEAMIAIIVAALGILGILGMQMRTLADTQTSVRRAQAVRLIEDLDERLKINPNTLLNLTGYLSAFGATLTPPGTNCRAAACNATQLAAFDVYEWKTTVKNSLPLGDASIFLAKGDLATNRRQLGVMVSWRENERDSSDDFKNRIDATKTEVGAGTYVSAGGDVACPADRTCHVQYLPVFARCAPYYAGGTGAAQLFCAGS